MNFSIPGYPNLSYGSIYCIGRNYAEHISEMKSQKTETPVIFLKPRSSIIHSGDKVRIPAQSSNVHHEVELVLLIGKNAASVSKENALKYIKAVAVGIDLTARDIQSDAKKAGLPWSLSKGFNTFAPIGNFVDAASIPDLQKLELFINVNGEIRQNGSTSDMIFSIPDLISYLSHQFTLTPGDLIFTGTPKGVSQIFKGDRISATLGSTLSTLDVHVSD